MDLFSLAVRRFKVEPLEFMLLAIILLLLSLSVVFAFLDLDISIFLVDENSLWGNFGATYGEFPGYILIAVAATTFTGSLIRNNKKQKIPAYILITAAAIYTCHLILQNQQTNAILTTLIMATSILFTAMTFKKDYKNYRTLALVILILAFLNAFLFVQISKTFFGRTRFRDLTETYSNYTPWYIPQGITGNQSFPSGHTAMGFMLLPLLIPTRNLSWRAPQKTLTIIIVISWGLFVGASRIIVGAHYASDVLFSAGIAAILTILLYRKFYSKTNKL